jgi:hypothetical protein
MALGFGVLLTAEGVVGLMLSMLLLGVGQGFLFPLLLYQTAQACSGEKRTLAIALVSSMRFFAQFIIPYAFSALGWVFNTTAIRDYFTFSLVALILVVIGGTLWLILRPRIMINAPA